MINQVVIGPEAAHEIQVGFDWYEEKNDGLGTEFLRAADACLSTIRRNPEAYPVMYKDVRRALLRKFPYALFYLVEADRIVVIACFHVKRNEIDWLRRV